MGDRLTDERVAYFVEHITNYYPPLEIKALAAEVLEHRQRRCGTCKLWVETDHSTCCTRWGLWSVLDADDFCSRWEARDD